MKKLAKLTGLLLLSATIFACSQNQEAPEATRDEATEPLISESESTQLTVTKSIDASDNFYTLVTSRSADGTYKYQCLMITETSDYKEIDSIVFTYSITNKTAASEPTSVTTYQTVTVKSVAGKTKYRTDYPSNKLTWNGLKGTYKVIENDPKTIQFQTNLASLLVFGGYTSSALVYSNTSNTKFYETYTNTEGQTIIISIVKQ